MKIWLRTNKAIANLPNTCGVSVVFRSLFKAFKNLKSPNPLYTPFLKGGWGIDKGGFNLDISLDDPGEKCVEVWWGWDWEPKENGNLLVGYTTGETLLKDMPGYDLFSVIFVPTAFYQQWQTVFESKIPIYKWPLGVDIDLFPIIKHDFTSTFIFTHVGVTQVRKGSHLACQAFAEEFSPAESVALEIISPGETEMFLALKEQYHKHKNMLFINKTVDRREMYKNYTGHCLVFPSLREGWGLQLTEALATGMPALVPRFPIFKDQFNDFCGWWIEPSNTPSGIGIFPLPDVQDLKRKMRYCVENRKQCEIKGKYAAKYVRENLTWEHGIIRNFLPVIEVYNA